MERAKLSDEEVSELSKLEQLYHNKYLTAEFLHQLITLYVKAIESFTLDSKTMRQYFMNKMQFVLSCPEILKLLEHGGEVVENIRETVRNTERPMFGEFADTRVRQKDDRISDEANKEKIIDDRFGNYQENHHHIHKNEHHHYHYDESKSNQRNLKIDMKMKLMREVEENMKNIHQEVKQADHKFEQNEEKIKNIRHNQEKELEQRRAKRKNKRKKSVEIKRQSIQIDDEEQIPEPIIKKSELIEAQKELTTAVYNFTVRMNTERLKEMEREEVKGRVKKTRDLDDDDDSNQEPSAKEMVSVPQPEMNMKKNKMSSQAVQESSPQVRIKTTRRKLDSDEDD